MWHALEWLEVSKIIDMFTIFFCGEFIVLLLKRSFFRKNKPQMQILHTVDIEKAFLQWK